MSKQDVEATSSLEPAGAEYGAIFAMGKLTQLRRGKNDWIGRDLHAGDFIESELLLDAED